MNVLWNKPNKILTYLDKEYNYGNYNAAREWSFYGRSIEVGVVTEEQLLRGDFDKTLPLVIPSMPFTNVATARTLGELISRDEIKAIVVGRFGEYLHEELGPITTQGPVRNDAFLGLSVAGFIEGKKPDVIRFDERFYTVPGKAQIAVGKDKISIVESANQKVYARWSDGSPALVEQMLGRGSFLYYGTHMFHENSAISARHNTRLMAAFAQWASGL